VTLPDMTPAYAAPSRRASLNFGPLLLLIALLGASVYFAEGGEALFTAWQLPEYSHGPLIPLLSGFIFLNELKSVPERPGAVDLRWPGVALVAFSLLLGLLGHLARIPDIVGYATILWIGGVILTSFGWARGRRFWPGVLHLVFMLPLPGLFYYKVSTTLQFISSELGVWMLQMLQVPVFLDGNIIDLGEYKLHVAEACSGLRYLFPIMSFSYVFAVLYRGPNWHKAVLLLSAAPLAVLMNSARIALVGVMVNNFGIEQAEGLSHLLEGWVVFLACVLILFGLAWTMLRLQKTPMPLSEALELNFDGLGTQLMRLRLVQASRAMAAVVLLSCAAAAAWTLAPERHINTVARQDFNAFPVQLADWTGVSDRKLEPNVERVLAADDYLSRSYVRAGDPVPVEVFMAWYDDQSKGGIHSPEVCLPGGGWEMSKLNTVDLAGDMGLDAPMNVNRAVIRKGGTELLVYYWFDQNGRRLASDYAAKAMLLWNGLTEGRTDGGLVRLTTPILRGESDAVAEARLQGLLRGLLVRLPEFVPGRAP
jgi:exosortase D (VPLPA-CTERM-specific)